MVSLITYNILSPDLCNPDDFLDYDFSDLDQNSRKSKIILLIDEWTSFENPPIIALQEVPYCWKGSLEKIFLNRNYNYFSMNYGYKKNGYFGVAIAVPKIYEIEKIEYLPVAEFIKSAYDDYDYYDELKQISMTNFLSKIVLMFNPPEISPLTFIDNAKKRTNFAIRLTLKKDFTFMVYNYHMPCAFKIPIVQTLHVDALKMLFAEHPTIPYLLATDFNLVPDSIGYNYFTKNDLSSEHKEYLIKSNHTEITMQSSYQQINKVEPEFTCYSKTKWGGEFKNCLDYIFMSNHWNCIESKLLITTTEKMPNRLCPSDHLPLNSNFEIKNKD